MATPEDISTRIDWLNEHICELDLDDSTFNKLKDKIARLSAKTSVFHSLQGPARQLRTSSSLPQANGRLTRFFEALYGETRFSSMHTLRWQKIRGLSCEALLLIGVAYNTLDITKMGRVEFECLMDHAEPYLDSKPLPEKWIFRKEIQLAIATASDMENMSEFRKRYFALEFNAEIETDKRHRKRRRDDSPPPDDGQTNDGPDSELRLHHGRIIRCSGAYLPDHQNYLQEPEAESRSPSSAAEVQNTQVSGTQLVVGEQTQNKREIQYMFSKSPADLAPLLGDLLSDAMRASNQWTSERRIGESTTECLTVLIPEGEEEDISITLWAGRRPALRIIEIFRMQWTWSPSPNHVSPPPHARQALGMSDLF